LPQHSFDLTSSYSKLTTTLAARGDGAENLTRIINPYLQFMVDIVEKSGGDIIKFIGDAILISWEQKGSQEETVASACWGCLKLLERLGDHQVEIPGGNKVLLSMHIGLAVGETFDVHVGTEQRMEYFLSGKAVKDSVRLVNVAEKKQIAISPEAFRLLELFKEDVKIELEVEGRRDGIVITKMEFPKEATAAGVSYNFSARNAPEPPPPKKIYQKYINESIAHRIMNFPNLSTDFDVSSMNEIRKVSIVFLKIERIDAHSPNSLQEMQNTIETVLQVLVVSALRSPRSPRSLHFYFLLSRNTKEVFDRWSSMTREQPC